MADANFSVPENNGAIVPAIFANAEFELQFLPVGDSFRVVATELARNLGFRDAYRLVESLPDEEKGYTLSCTPGGEQQVWTITEPGFYRAIGQRQASRVKDINVRARVERFQRWVYSDVLPSIRKTGQYSISEAPTTIAWEQAAAIARLRHGFNVNAGDLRDLLTRGGILTLTGRPHKKWEKLFWPLASRWEIHEEYVPHLIAFAAQVQHQITEAAKILQLSLPLSTDATRNEIEETTR